MAEASMLIPQSQSVRPDENPRPVDRPGNVGDLERWLSLVGGGLLAVYSLRRSLGNFMLLFGACALVYRGLTGHCALYQTMQVSTVSGDRHSGSLRDTTEPNETARIVIARS